MTIYKIQKNVSKFQEVTYVIIERNEVIVNGIKGFETSETGYNFKTIEQAESKLAFIIKINS
jgi:hypothetical protein